MIIINILTVLACVYVLWRAKQVTEYNNRQLRMVKETKYLRGRRSRTHERF